MDDLNEVSGIYRKYYGYADICLPLKNNSGGVATGTIITTSGERIAFELFHAYTSIEGFAAYYHRNDNGGKPIFINRSHIQRILID